MPTNRIIAIHGVAGAGKTTLLKSIEDYHHNSMCQVIIESVDDLFNTRSYRRRPSLSLSTTVVASKKIIRKNYSILTFRFISLLCFFYMTNNGNQIWAIAFFLAFFIPSIAQFLASQLLSKLWNYYSNNYVKFQIEKDRYIGMRSDQTDIRWFWFDRNCVDVYGFCCIDQPVCVPTDFLPVLKSQTDQTSVAIIMDTPAKIICRHLAARICGQTSTKIVRIVTKLLMSIPFMVQTTLKALEYIEQWYTAFNVPIIKISQIYKQLDKDEKTQEILWTKNSIDVLLKAIEKSIGDKQPIAEQQREAQQVLLKPWLERTRRNSTVH